MSLKRLNARFYRTGAGNEPVRDWLKEMSAEDRARIGEAIKKVEYGWPIGMPTCRPLKDGVSEIRVDLASNRAVRVLFCIHAGCVVLLHGFIKKTQTTPEADIKLALARMKEL